MGPGVSALSDEEKQAEKLRLEGNKCFSKDRFQAAIDAYTAAITLCPKVPVYWTNRALCHRRRNDWTRVEEDSRKAIQLDHYSVKAHYMLGLALLQKQEYSEGVKELEKALDLGRGANPNGYMVEEIWEELAKAKYLEWEEESTQRSWELQSLKEACEEALKEKHFLDNSETEGFLDDPIVSIVSHLQQLELLGQVFQKAAEDDTPSEVPDYLCCKITLDILRDPVITPSGVSYERAVLLDHLEKVGNFDPITREPLEPSQLVPNLAIKEAVHAYLDKHGWAYKTESN
ncbi:E3 ubiquitin-protein ligase CHIP [Populus alba x Populus x berolinensis]|uniref:E3 ubiquitin-protein ligase CHIP n=3 Tax=Populus TaxID=3689 RepID=A0A4U5QMS7_POPAL|nr:E3 ubiquitin-protein ligase CHIP [Populus alba]KAJ6956518.1 E3 ubiquitin-protein ligase CHIP [Populus alba x Populus x berolinensis]KAJ7008879.1 E3 ubiquitin-protein ligase CHIP [Populus alba x Populus x berolinensis]TKS12093.1 tetratricopeptide repeat-containing family protein [Populus alba]